MKSLRICLLAGVVSGMMTLVGCTGGNGDTPAKGEGAGGVTPPASSTPAKKAGFVCEKCGKASETAAECCGAAMKKVGA